MEVSVALPKSTFIGQTVQGIATFGSRTDFRFISATVYSLGVFRNDRKMEFFYLHMKNLAGTPNHIYEQADLLKLIKKAYDHPFTEKSKKKISTLTFPNKEEVVGPIFGLNQGGSEKWKFELPAAPTNGLPTSQGPHHFIEYFIILIVVRKNETLINVSDFLYIHRLGHPPNFESRVTDKTENFTVICNPFVTKSAIEFKMEWPSSFSPHHAKFKISQHCFVHGKKTSKVLKREFVSTKFDTLSHKRTMNIMRVPHSAFGRNFSLAYQLEIKLKGNTKYSIKVPFIYYPDIPPAIEEMTSSCINLLCDLNLGDFYNYIFVSTELDQRRQTFSSTPRPSFLPIDEYPEDVWSSSSDSYPLDESELNMSSSSLTLESLGKNRNILIFSFSDPENEGRKFINNSRKIILAKEFEPLDFVNENLYTVHPTKANSDSKQFLRFPDTLNFIDTSSFLEKFNFGDSELYHLKSILSGLPEKTNLSKKPESHIRRLKFKSHGIIIVCDYTLFWKNENVNINNTNNNNTNNNNTINDNKEKEEKVEIKVYKANLKKLENFAELCKQLGIPPFIIMTHPEGKKISKTEFKKFLKNMKDEIISARVFYEYDEEILQKVVKKFKLHI